MRRLRISLGTLAMLKRLAEITADPSIANALTELCGFGKGVAERLQRDIDRADAASEAGQRDGGCGGGLWLSGALTRTSARVARAGDVRDADARGDGDLRRGRPEGAALSRAEVGWRRMRRSPEKPLARPAGEPAGETRAGARAAGLIVRACSPKICPMRTAPPRSDRVHLSRQARIAFRSSRSRHRGQALRRPSPIVPLGSLRNWSVARAVSLFRAPPTVLTGREPGRSRRSGTIAESAQALSGVDVHTELDAIRERGDRLGQPAGVH